MEYYADDAAAGRASQAWIVRGKENIRNAFIAIADYFQHRLVVTQGKMEITRRRRQCAGDYGNPAGYPDGGSRDNTQVTRGAQPMFFAQQGDSAGSAPWITPTVRTCSTRPPGLNSRALGKVLFAKYAGRKVAIAAIANDRHHYRARIFTAPHVARPPPRRRN